MKRWHVVVILLLVILFYVLATGFAMYFRLLYGIGLGIRPQLPVEPPWDTRNRG